MNDYDAWLFDHPDDHEDEFSKNEEIERIMNEHNLDWDEAEDYFNDMIEQADQDAAEARALEMLECGRN